MPDAKGAPTGVGVPSGGTDRGPLTYALTHWREGGGALSAHGRLLARLCPFGHGRARGKPPWAPTFLHVRVEDRCAESPPGTVFGLPVHGYDMPNCRWTKSSLGNRSPCLKPDVADAPSVCLFPSCRAPIINPGSASYPGTALAADARGCIARRPGLAGARVKARKQSPRHRLSASNRVCWHCPSITTTRLRRSGNADVWHGSASLAHCGAGCLPTTRAERRASSACAATARRRSDTPAGG